MSVFLINISISTCLITSNFTEIVEKETSEEKLQMQQLHL